MEAEAAFLVLGDSLEQVRDELPISEFEVYSDSFFALAVPGDSSKSDGEIL